MEHSRRQLIGSAAVTLGAALVGGSRPVAASTRVSSADIAQLFAALPGTNAFKVVAPATARTPAVDLSMNAGERMFIGSSFKAFVAAEALRQDDSAGVVAAITERQLALDASVWSPDSATFNPPHLSGQVSQRTAMEAMVLHSDNTGTDMTLKQVGPDNVRTFIASAGLTNSLIPNSTRSFIGYLLNAPDPQAFTWDDFVAKENDPFVNPPLNDTNTMASSPDDLASFFSRALQGDFFENDATLREFRALLSIGDIIWLMPLPLGVSAFAKGGEIDSPGFHALCAAGGMFFDDVWVYFAFIINWPAPEQSDPATQAGWAKAGASALQLIKD
jgi:beta-lactamase class A